MHLPTGERWTALFLTQDLTEEHYQTVPLGRPKGLQRTMHFPRPPEPNQIVQHFQKEMERRQKLVNFQRVKEQRQTPEDFQRAQRQRLMPGRSLEAFQTQQEQRVLRLVLRIH